MPGTGDADLGPATVTLLGIIGTGEGALDPIGEGPREDEGMLWNGDWLRPLASLFCAAAKATLPSDWGACGKGDALLGGSGLFMAGWLWPKNLTAERTNDCLFIPTSLAPWLAILLAEISPAKRGVQTSKISGGGSGGNCPLSASSLSFSREQDNGTKPYCRPDRCAPRIERGGELGQYPREPCSS
jgi:hypothetical protein